MPMQVIREITHVDSIVNAITKIILSSGQGPGIQIANI
jgi:hypothetical protein